MTAKRLTDIQKQKIVADRVEGMSIRALAKKYSVSTTTIHNVIKLSGDELTQKLTDKKEQNTQDVLAYLDSKADSLKRLGDYILDQRLNPITNKTELDELPIREVVMAYGTMTDKMLKSKEISYKTKSDVSIEKINQNIQNIADLLSAPVPVRKIPDDE